MDQKWLITIVISAVIGAVTKELLAFIAKHSMTVAKMLIKVATALFVKEPRMALMLFDLLMSFICAMVIILSLRSQAPATIGASAMLALMALISVNSGISARDNSEILRDQRIARRNKKSEPNQTLLPTTTSIMPPAAQERRQP